MPNIFPRWTNWLPFKIVFIVVLLVFLLVNGVTYYFTPKYTRVGYMPNQPVSFSHALHVEQLGMDCRYCHYSVETSSHSNVPTVQTCMSCHQHIQQKSEKLAPIRAAWESGQPVLWVRIHQAPDYVYFNHAAHVNRGISCQSCHGQVNHMTVVWHHEPHSMGWCLECHRRPENFIRELSEVYNLNYTISPEEQRTLGKKLVQEWAVSPPQNCAGCHR